MQVQVNMMREKQVAAYMGLSPITVRKFRIDGVGPRYVKLARAVLYDPEDVVAWIEARKVSSTSQAPQVAE